MIRMIQRKLIIPRGDTGSFSIPALTTVESGDVAVFSIIDELTHTIIGAQKQVAVTGNTLTIEFTHNDTVNLPVGTYVWDIKYYRNPVFADGYLVNGEEINSYYAAYSLPKCEIRETADQLLVSDNSPTATLTAEQLDVISAALAQINQAVQETEANAAHYPYIGENNNWFLWDNETGAFIDTNVSAIGPGIQEGGTTGQILKKASNLDFDTLWGDETDPTVPAWAKEPTKPSYTAAEVGALPDDTFIPANTSDLTNDSNFAVDANYVHTDNNYTTAEKTKLSSIAAGAEVNVNADWNAVSGDAQILNKPTIPDIQIYGTSIVENGVANIPMADANTLGVVKVKNNSAYGVRINSNTGLIDINAATSDVIKGSSPTTRPIIPYYQHESTFYGLAKAAGDSTQSQSENAIGTYTDEAKAAIQSMLGVPSTSALTAKQDALTFDSTPTASSINPVTSGGIKSYVDTAVSNINTMKIHICTAQEYNAETGVPTIQNPDTQTFYLVPGGEGSNLFIEWAYVNSAWERFGSADVEVPVTDVQINGSSIINTGIANIPVAGTSSSNLGVVWVYAGTRGISIDNNGQLLINPATSSNIKTGTNTFKPIVSSTQHESTFYGLAKAAGDTTQSQSNNAIGTYTNEAKTAIRSMLGVPATSDITVTDVKINNSSIVTNGIANIPIAATGSEQAYGLVRGNVDWGTQVNSSGELIIAPAMDSDIQVGISFYRPITPASLYKAVFYGLARAAGDSTQSISQNPIGTYTADAKAAIQQMLDVPSTTDIPDVPVTDVQINGTSIVNNAVANIPAAGVQSLGAVKVASNTAGGINIQTGNNAGQIEIAPATSANIKAGIHERRPITPTTQHTAVFYGLSKVAGVDLANETVTLGTYPATAQTAIRSMLNAASPDLIDIQTTQPTATDNKLWIDETATSGIQVPTVSEMNNAVVEQVNNSIVVSTTQPSAATNKIWINSSAEGAVQVPTVSEMNTALGGKVSDVQVNSVSVVSGGVANIPIGSRTTLGVVSCGDDSEQTGIVISNEGIIKTDYAGALSIKQGANLHKPIVPYFIKEAVFYGMAKAAGDTTQSASSNAVGTYTDSAKASIKQMLGIVDGSTGTVDVSGAAPSITAIENTRYVCGEVTVLSFTPAANGICIVRFTSGSTATSLTVPNTVKFPEWFDPTSLETNTVYEICVTDGIYGAVMSWAQ